jgi:hypothetical protein
MKNSRNDDPTNDTPALFIFRLDLEVCDPTTLHSTVTISRMIYKSFGHPGRSISLAKTPHAFIVFNFVTVDTARLSLTGLYAYS